MSNRISKEFVYKGYNCFVVEISSGYRCGYVEIPKDSLFFNKRYNEELPISKDVIGDEPLGKRSYIDLVCNSMSDSDNIQAGFIFNVHGGITYTESYLFDKEDSWFYGFDCAHSGDAYDVSIMDDKYREMFDHGLIGNNGAVRTEEYVISELKSLVDQIIKIDSIYNKNYMENKNELEISYHSGINSQTATLKSKNDLGITTKIHLDEEELKFLLQSLLRNVNFEIK